jgi:hypothetical protein
MVANSGGLLSEKLTIEIGESRAGSISVCEGHCTPTGLRKLLRLMNLLVFGSYYHATLLMLNVVTQKDPIVGHIL